MLISILLHCFMPCNTDMCFSPANSTAYFFSPGYQHSVLITGLLPYETYYYTIGGTPSGQSKPIWSDVYSFKSHPGVGNVTTSTIIYGDLGVTIPYADVTSSYYPAAMNLNHFADILAQHDTETAASPRLIVHIGLFSRF